MSNLKGVVRQIAISTDDDTVVVELICSDAYAAQVLNDDLTSRLKTDRVLALTVKVGASIEDNAS